MESIDSMNPWPPWNPWNPWNLKLSISDGGMAPYMTDVQSISHLMEFACELMSS